MKFIKKEKLFLIKFLLIPIVLSLIAYQFFHASAQFEKGDEQTKYLQNLNEMDIAKIELCESEMCQSRMDLTDPSKKESKNLFAHGMHDLDSYSPNHDSAIQEFYIIMYNIHGEKFEFDTYLKDYKDHTVYMHLLERPIKEEMHWLNLGSRKSSELYKWLEYHNLVKEKV